jgi:hypothetical protein
MTSLRGPLTKKISTLWEREKNDWYREPLWCSARLFQQEKFQGIILDPAAGGGNILQSAIEAGYRAEGSDLVIRNPALVWGQRDWLEPCSLRWDNIVSNPPFGLCDDRKTRTHPFVERCLERAERKVALLMPANWVQGLTRSQWLEATPLRRVYFLAPRPSMPPGQFLEQGGKAGNGTTDYAWFVWQIGYDGRPEICWLRRAP